MLHARGWLDPRHEAEDDTLATSALLLAAGGARGSSEGERDGEYDSLQRGEKRHGERDDG
jgi:hypothetical protein